MTILSVLQDAATVIGLAVPSSVYGSTEREHVELGALANTMAKRIAFDTHDWTVLKTLATLTGDGTTTAHSRPTDYKRMLKKATLWPSASPGTPLVHVPDTDEWLSYDVLGLTTGVGRWTLIGSTINIKPAVANAATVKFYYITNLIVDPAAGSNKTDFTMDTDAFLLDEEMLKLGIIWQWKASKGRPYAEDMQNYEDAKAARIGEDKGSNILTVGSVRFPSDVKIAYPGVIVG